MDDHREVTCDLRSKGNKRQFGDIEKMSGRKNRPEGPQDLSAVNGLDQHVPQRPVW